MKNAFGDEIEDAGPAGAVNAFGDPVEAEPAAPEKGFLGKVAEGAGNALAFVGRGVDRISGVPLRAAITEVQDARDARGGRKEGLRKFLDPQEYADVGRAGLGYLKNFGGDPDKTPTGPEVMARQGLSEEGGAQVGGYDPVLGYPNLTAPVQNGKGASPAEMAGFALDAAAPIPGLGALKVAGKAAAPVSRMAGEAAEGAAKVVDVATGTKVTGKAVRGAKSAIKALGDSFDSAREGLKATFGAKQSDDFGRSVEVAMRNGIDPKMLPEAVEFGPSSIITRTARVQAEGPLGQPLLEKFDKAKGAVREAINRDVTRIGGSQLPTPVQAGEILREGFNAGVERAFADVATSHNKILAASPDLRLSQERIRDLAGTLTEMEAWAQKKIDLGSTKTAKTQGRQILSAVESIRKSGESYAGSLEALREIGSVAFKSTNTAADISPDVARYRRLYGALNDAMIGTVDDVFEAGTAEALRESNAAMSKIFGDKGLLGKLGEKTASGEDLFRSVVRNGSSKEILALKEYLTPEQIQAVKGTFLHDMIKLDPEGNFTFRSTFNRLRDNWDAADALFEPGEIDNFVDLIRLGDKFGNAVMSTSGTGASGAFGEFLKTSKNRLIDDPIAANRKNKARAIGFDLDEPAGRAAARSPGPGPIMSLRPGTQQAIGDGLRSFQLRSRAARQFSTRGEDKDR